MQVSPPLDASPNVCATPVAISPDTECESSSVSMQFPEGLDVVMSAVGTATTSPVCVRCGVPQRLRSSRHASTQTPPLSLLVAQIASDQSQTCAADTATCTTRNICSEFTALQQQLITQRPTQQQQSIKPRQDNKQICIPPQLELAVSRESSNAQVCAPGCRTAMPRRVSVIPASSNVPGSVHSYRRLAAKDKRRLGAGAEPSLSRFIFTVPTPSASLVLTTTTTNDFNRLVGSTTPQLMSTSSLRIASGTSAAAVVVANGAVTTNPNAAPCRSRVDQVTNCGNDCSASVPHLFALPPVSSSAANQDSDSITVVSTDAPSNNRTYLIHHPHQGSTTHSSQNRNTKCSPSPVPFDNAERVNSVFSHVLCVD
eukprot:Lankesteria_metandrocarpae@DN5105_c0_g1_i2.p1